MKTIKETCYKGTRIILGNTKRSIIDSMIKLLRANEFEEISVPIIQNIQYFKSKIGEENNNLMFSFKDRGNRDLCLAPEYTSIIQELSNTYFKNNKDVKIFYIQECFRGEKPQFGRYRQFTQLGVEIINPTDSYKSLQILKQLACTLVEITTNKYILNDDVTRGLDYYKEGKGFEIVCEELKSAKQICGGGEYDGGVGFAIGIDRLLL